RVRRPAHARLALRRAAAAHLLRRRAPMNSPAPRAERRTATPGRLPSVLVVDDEVRSQESLRRTLDEDFEVYTASSADEALAVLEREWIEIVLTDQRMPG